MDKYTLFESYLTDKLEPSRKADFEQRLTKDTEFKREFDEHVKTHASLDILLEGDIHSVIKEIKAKEVAITAGNKSKWLIYPLAGLLAGLLITGALVFLNEDEAKNEKQLIAEYYRTPMSASTRGSQDKVFNAQTARIQESTINAHNLMKEGRYKEATTAFQNVLMMVEGKERERTEWFLILSMLEHDINTATSLLQLLTQNSQHIKHQEAVKLAAELEAQ